MAAAHGVACTAEKADGKGGGAGEDKCGGRKRGRPVRPAGLATPCSAEAGECGATMVLWKTAAIVKRPKAARSTGHRMPRGRDQQEAQRRIPQERGRADGRRTEKRASPTPVGNHKRKGKNQQCHPWGAEGGDEQRTAVGRP